MGEGGSIWSADGSDDMVGYPRVQGGSAYGRMQRPEYSYVDITKQLFGPSEAPPLLKLAPTSHS